MAATEIRIRNAVGGRAPDPSEVPLNAGDVVTFTAESDAAVVLRFSAEASGILSPVPGTTGVELAGGDRASFRVTASAPGRYGLALQLPEDSQGIIAESQQGGNAAILAIKAAPPPPYGGPDVIVDAGESGR
jgi:hypothetical protein